MPICQRVIGRPPSVLFLDLLFAARRVRAPDTADPAGRRGWALGEAPSYERHGEERVAAGVYREALRFREHVLPVQDALWTHSERGA